MIHTVGFKTTSNVYLPVSFVKNLYQNKILYKTVQHLSADCRNWFYYTGALSLVGLIELATVPSNDFMLGISILFPVDCGWLSSEDPCTQAYVQYPHTITTNTTANGPVILLRAAIILLPNQVKLDIFVSNQ